MTPGKQTPGKHWGMRRLADRAGHWKMVAIDQRGVIFGPMAQARGAAEAAPEDIAAVKRALARHLAPHCSAILVDPNYGYEPAIAEVPPRTGLILACEHHVTETTPGGRKSVPMPGWDAARIRRTGADALKLLVWYRADASPEVRAHQEGFVRDMGEACRREDLVFLLEPLIYPLPGESETALEARRPELVTDSIRPFTAPEYGVDIFKVEPPGPIHGVPDPHGPAAAALQAHYDRLGAMLPRPWVLLSAGGGAADFERSLVYACRAGASGFLAGRAIWAEAFSRFPDMAAMEAGLAGGSRRMLARIGDLTDRLGTPWPAKALVQPL